MATCKEDSFTGTRLTVTTPLAYSTVMERLDTSIGLYSTAGWPKIAKYLESDSPTKEGFVNIATSFIGAQHFMIFWEIDHSLWTPLYGIAPGRKIKRIVVGNPMSAATVMKYDLKAGLAAPVELLIIELEGNKGTDVVFQRFSRLTAEVGGVKNDELTEAAVRLDGRVQELVDFITRPE
jgi:uncharacterized protein (DUF302 family)